MLFINMVLPIKGNSHSWALQKAFEVVYETTKRLRGKALNGYWTSTLLSTESPFGKQQASKNVTIWDHGIFICPLQKECTLGRGLARGQLWDRLGHNCAR